MSVDVAKLRLAIEAADDSDYPDVLAALPELLDVYERSTAGLPSRSVPMSDENPRGWQFEDMFVDLARVVAAIRFAATKRSHGISLLWVDYREKPLEWALSDEAHADLLNVLEMYRSGR